MQRFKIFVVIMLAFLTGGLIALWRLQTRSVNVPDKFKPAVDQTTPLTISPRSTLSAAPVPFLAEETISSLQASISSLLARIGKLEQGSSQNTAARPPSTPIVFQPQVVYLGSASTTKHEWTDSGIEVMLNTADYPADVSVVFEAGLSIIGGEAWARLKNKTSGAIISISEVSHNNNTVTWKSSPSFKLHPGNNTYVVQLRSTSGETAKLSGARLKITR
jgi:hypothetical protein